MVGQDLLSPLQAIKNAVYVANNYPEENEKMMNIIGDSTDYTARILKDLRDLTCSTTPVITEVNLTDFPDEKIRGHRTDETITITVNVDNSVNTAYFDPVKIRRVIDNLVKNFVEVIEESGTITITACIKNKCLKVEISDTGKGIPYEYLNTLFQLFQTTKSKGLGLGLAYCKQAVEAHEGEISVESKLNEGTKFTFTLPLKTVEI